MRLIVTDLRVSICDESSVEEGIVGRQHAVGSVARSGTGSFPGIETVIALMTINAWHLELSYYSGMAGAVECYVYAIRDCRSAKGFGFLIRSAAISLVVADTAALWVS